MHESCLITNNPATSHVLGRILTTGELLSLKQHGGTVTS